MFASFQRFFVFLFVLTYVLQCASGVNDPRRVLPERIPDRNLKVRDSERHTAPKIRQWLHVPTYTNCFRVYVSPHIIIQSSWGVPDEGLMTRLRRRTQIIILKILMMIRFDDTAPQSRLNGILLGIPHSKGSRAREYVKGLFVGWPSVEIVVLIKVLLCLLDHSVG